MFKYLWGNHDHHIEWQRVLIRNTYRSYLLCPVAEVGYFLSILAEVFGHCYCRQRLAVTLDTGVTGV